jgi:hypothetical protein
MSRPCVSCASCSWQAREHRESALRTNLNDNSSQGVLHCGILAGQ